MPPIDRLPDASIDVARERLEQLRDIAPDAFTEGGIDEDALRRSLGGPIDARPEKFGLSWPGKAESVRLIQQPSVATLRPMREASVSYDDAEHVLVEGDNLEVLKVLQRSYYGKVKLIYIDPPYNTGGEFIYPDDFREGLADYLRRSQQRDGHGFKASTHAETQGRFHSKWLSMIYPRLFLARNLLTDDGVCMVSIDDNEVFALRAVMNEIFGEGNFLCTLIWNKQHSQQQGMFKKYHEYVVVFARDASQIGSIEGGDGIIEAGALKRISKKNSASEFVFPAGVRFDAPDGTALSGTYGDAEKVTVVNGRLVARGGKTVEPVTLSAGWTQKNQMIDWFAGRDVLDTRGQKVLEFYFNSKGKLKCRKERTRVTPSTILPEYGMVSAQTEYLSTLFDGKAVFDNPKPVAMISDFLSWFVGDGDIVLDFFAGSGTTCEAVLEHDRRARFVGVQLPEAIDEQSESGKAALSLGLRNIAELGRERVRRVIDRLGGTAGFRAFRLDASNFMPWEGAADAKIGETLALSIDNVLPDRSNDDLLVEIALRAGLSLAEKVVELPHVGKDVYDFDDGAMFVCLDRALSLGVIDAMLARKPKQIVCLDAGFGRNDTLKLNAVAAAKESNIALRVI